ncbi:cell division protein FtsK [Amycolatopsis cynarae]|uniref:Cell division protein FtsK n=1 Tax=Amycolatopsis cynarae TaxID=2995223 RepID=A0ABY7B2D9_9PSEU|nr:cell division protein FtsK [Amycolatopsis sp. HUAS 11-8]WAL65604.1 cell division protein FtsK [Amycolatopsis sp. HUAS 11-8]
MSDHHNTTPPTVEDPTMDTRDQPTPGEELAEVHYLPQRHPDAAPTPMDTEVVEAELVSDEDWHRLQQAKRLARYQGYRRDIVTVARGVRTVATHQHTKTAGKTLLAAGVTTLQGVESWGRRAWDASTMGVYRRQIKAAEAMGDREALAEWTERKEASAERRHKRLMDLPKIAWGVSKVILGSLAGCVALTLLVGLFVQLSGSGEFVKVISGVLAAMRWIFTSIAVAWTPFVMALPAFVLLAAYREGRRRGQAPAWLATAREADMDAAIDETTIARALEALRIPQINAYLKQGLPLQYLTTARADGRGTHAVIRLPAGVTAEKIARRRADLATGLHRLAKEVWPTTGSEAGILDLWVADKGALAEGAGPYPLLTDGAVDVFKGVPFGKTLRGNPLVAPLMERNTITGGMPGQGKSSAARVIMAGAALDPTAELRIYVPDANFDFEAFKPRCSRYVMGAEDEKIAQILADLRELHAEVQARGELLIKFEVPAVTRELASKNVGLHPLFCLLEEAHVAIQHPKYGKEISKLLVDIVRLGRKRGIHLIVSTQAPTKDSMPRDVTRNCSNGIAFAVGDHVANDALLGQGAYAAGHRATELIPGTDKGTAVVKGFTGERSDIVQVYFLDVARDNDQVTPIIERSLAAIEDAGRGLPGGDRPVREIEPGKQRDLLEDLDEVLGNDPVPAARVAPLLSALDPDWPPYQGLTGTRLCAELAMLGVKVPSSKNRYPIDPVTIREALAVAATADLDDDE